MLLLKKTSRAWYYFPKKAKVAVLVLLAAALLAFTPEEEKILLKDVAEIKATLKVFMEQTDKRFEELKADMNKRFEQVDKRFDQMTNFLWMLVAIFTALTAAVIGFAYWDRRTIIRKASDEAIERINREGRWKDLLNALIELSKKMRSSPRF